MTHENGNWMNSDQRDATSPHKCAPISKDSNYCGQCGWPIDKNAKPEPINLDAIRTDVAYALKQLERAKSLRIDSVVDDSIGRATDALERVAEALKQDK